MHTIARGISYIDLQFLGKPRIIATGVLQGSGGVALVDPGPSTCLDRLRATLSEQGIAVGDVRTILLTHIHLDHAGVTGTLLRECPDIQVYVHERGAPHMVDPAKLLNSATRLYGADMDRLWGEFLPVPESNVHSLGGGERITVADRQLEVAYTPGHASHHVSFLDRASGVAFVGDTAGIRTGADLFAMPPTPPPDIDIEVWKTSIVLIEQWQAETLFLTHFGPHQGPAEHLASLRAHLDGMAVMARTILEGTAS
ncbi:MAG: MBL fold metallo-hydrolase, partial [Acidobacteriota bacterium]|nr:MBL fold metallo-hydrolase [Acidobacteriota bacterium]